MPRPQFTSKRERVARFVAELGRQGQGLDYAQVRPLFLWFAQNHLTDRESAKLEQLTTLLAGGQVSAAEAVEQARAGLGVDQ